MLPHINCFWAQTQLPVPGSRSIACSVSYSHSEFRFLNFKQDLGLVSKFPELGLLPHIRDV